MYPALWTCAYSTILMTQGSMTELSGILVLSVAVKYKAAHIAAMTPSPMNVFLLFFDHALHLLKDRDKSVVTDDFSD